MKSRKNFLFKFSIVFGALAVLTIIFLIYCASIFRELEELMAETPQSPTTVMYARTYSFKPGDVLNLNALKENLALVKVAAKWTKVPGPAGSNKTQVQIEWQSTAFPEILTQEKVRAALYPADSQFPPSGSKVEMKLSEPANNFSVVEEISVQEPSAQAKTVVPILAMPPAVIAEASSDQHTIREYRVLDDIPTPVKNAFIAVEDARFLQHPGFDFRGLTRAMLVNLRRGAFVQGASTITQQLVKNLLKTHRKTVSRKMKELILSILIEVKYEKEQILERYLNEVYFGQVGSLEVHGVAQAAHYFFGKNLDRLTSGETAFLAGVVKGPNVYSPYRDRARAIERKNIVLKKLFEQRYLAQAEYLNAVKQNLEFLPPRSSRNEAPYFTDFIKASLQEDHLGLNIFTTLDLNFQNRLQKSVKQQIETLSGKFKHPLGLPLQAAVIAADHATGEILGLLGGKSFEESNYNRVLNSRRPVGSIFKPVVYLAALLKGHDESGKAYSPSYLIEDSPFTWKFDRQTWTPQNYERKFAGQVTLRDALAHSLNVPAARVGHDVGIENIVALSKTLGIGESMPAVPSTVLGTVELTTFEVLKLYSIFANRGEAVTLHGLRLITNSEGAILREIKPEIKAIHKPEYFELLKSLLGSVVAEGTARGMNQFHLQDEAYGKTGTTNDYRDAWFAGFTGPMTMVTWVGFDHYEGIPKKAKLAKLTGGGAALPVWGNAAQIAASSQLKWKKEIPVATVTTTGTETTSDAATATATNVPAPILQTHWVDVTQDCLVSSQPDANTLGPNGKKRFKEEVYIPELLPPVCATR